MTDYRGMTAGTGGGKVAIVQARQQGKTAALRKATRTVHDEQDLPSPGSSPRVPQAGLDHPRLAPEDEQARHNSPDSPYPSEHGHEVEQLPETGEGRREEVLKLAEEGLTHQEIADRVGLSRSYVSRIIRASRGDE